MGDVVAHEKAQKRLTNRVWAVEDDFEAEERIRRASGFLAQKLKEGEIKLPMLPAAATDALRLAQDPSASMRELEHVVQTDPAVAMRVLAVANSAAYGNHNIRTLGQALARLGTNTIRDILYQAVAESHIFQGRSVSRLAQERLHSVATAHVARIVCNRLGIDGEYAFLCGLLHDIGRAALIDMLADMLADKSVELLEQEEAQLVARMHAAVGAHLMLAWNLPRLVPEACRRHHMYRANGTIPYSQMGNVIAVADRIAIHYALGRPARPINMAGEPAFLDLGLDPAQIPEIIEMAEPVVGAVRSPSTTRQASRSGTYPQTCSGTYPQAGQDAPPQVHEIDGLPQAEECPDVGEDKPRRIAS